MPPHQYSVIQDTPTETFTEDIDDTTERYKEQLRQFSQYCHIFYSNSLSVKSITNQTKNPPHQIKKSLDFSSSTHDLETRSKTDENSIVETSKAVLQAFEIICASRKSLPHCGDQSHYAAIAQCGLLDPDFLADIGREKGTSSRLSSYSKARDEERCKVHEYLMKERKHHFMALLEQKTQEENSTDETVALESGPISMMKQWERENQIKSMAREFSNKYKSRIGVHPFLAGLRRLLESQMQHTQQMVYWSFDTAVITENCTHGNDALMQDALSLLVTFLQYTTSKPMQEDQDEYDKNKYGNDSSNITSNMIHWECKAPISISLLNRILNVLPKWNALDAKPTGTITVSLDMRSEPVVMERNLLCLDRKSVV